MKTLQNNLEEQNERSNAIIQPALEIGKEDDEYEKEADSVANKVMKMPDSSGSVQKMNDEEKEETKMAEGGEKIQMMKDSPLKINKMSAGSNAGLKASPKVEQSINHSKGKGQSLDAGLQSELGHKMGANFSEVKIHTDENAAQMNKEVGAKAFTHGNDIYFNSGQYNPSTNPGKHLLTHELTHTIQQGEIRSLVQREQIIPEKKQVHYNLSLHTADNYPAIIVDMGTTVNGIAEQTLPIFNDLIVDQGANPPPALTKDELAKAMIADRAVFLLEPSFQDNFKKGLLFPLPIQINPVTGEWTTNPNYIKAKAGDFKDEWRDYLDTIPSDYIINDFPTMAATLIAENPTNSALAIVLQLKIRKNPDEAYPLINEIFKLKGDVKYDLAIAITELITNKDRDIFAMTVSGFAISQLLLQALNKQDVQDPDKQKEAVNRVGMTELNLTKGKTITVTQEDWDNAYGDQFRLWDNYTKRYTLLSEDLYKFNIDPSTGTTKILSVGSEVYIPSPDELLFEEFVAKYKDRRIAAEKFAAYTLTPEYAVAKAGIELIGNEMVAPSYAMEKSVFYSPNPNLDHAKVVESTAGSDMVLYSVNWGATWKCNIFIHDAVYRGGYQPKLNSVQHYVRPGEMLSNSSVDPATDKNYLQIKIKDALPGTLLSFPGEGAAGHNAVLASFIIRTDKDGNEKPDGQYIKFKVMEAAGTGANKDERRMLVYPKSDEYTYYTTYYTKMNAYIPTKKRE